MQSTTGAACCCCSAAAAATHDLQCNSSKEGSQQQHGRKGARAAVGVRTGERRLRQQRGRYPPLANHGLAAPLQMLPVAGAVQDGSAGPGGRSGMAWMGPAAWQRRSGSLAALQFRVGGESGDLSACRLRCSHGWVSALGTHLLRKQGALWGSSCHTKTQDKEATLVATSTPLPAALVVPGLG